MSAITQQILEKVECLPEQLQIEALNFVEFLKNKVNKKELSAQSEEPNGTRLAQLMEQAASKNLFSAIHDPVAWQRKTRKDRPLPGRK